jgi:antitoxin (DNA-binding transcriptional repressor) of toxin-antitoxin stability system
VRSLANKKVREVAVSEFKTHCLSLLDQVNKTKTPFRVTRRGKAIADVFPAAVEQTGHSWIGSMERVIPITGDIVSAVVDLDDFEPLKDCISCSIHTFGSGPLRNRSASGKVSARAQ